jgi:adenylate cyclase
MTMTRRSRREWRIFLWVTVVAAIVSAGFGMRVRPESALHSALIGIVTSLMISTPIVLFQLKGDRVAVLRRLRRLPLAVYILIKVLFYFVVIVGGLMVSRYVASGDPVFAFDGLFRRGLVFAIGMSVVGSLAFDMIGLLGFGNLMNLLTGRYVQPRSEQRAFLLIDMKDSTGLAERLGPVRFHELLNEFFRDVADGALECDAEIHKYVGDEAILTWPDTDALADGDCLACPFLVQDIMAAKAETYRRQYGVLPEFRASLHRGEIIAGEIGDVRREIAFVGDTLNVAARLLDAAKQLGHDVLVSQDLLNRASLPPGLRAEALPTLTIRGRTAPLGIAALSRAN